MAHHSAAFSLVELSIVLVILGLLTGGILGGQNLMHAAELRSISKESTEYQMMFNTFRDKYMAIPGDMSNKNMFWPEESADCTYVTAAATGNETCYGDGDGVVEMSHELYTFWQHLHNAGLLNANMSGVATDSFDYQPGVNIPRSRFGEGSWILEFRGNLVGDGHRFDGNYGHMLFLSGGHRNDWPDYPIMTPEDAWNVDMKMDDGMPGQGKVVSIRRDADNFFDCTTMPDGSNPAADEIEATYRLSNTDDACALIFRNVL